jgi:dUTP pyrophosphatase
MSENLLVKIHPDCPNKAPISAPAKEGDVGYDLKVWCEQSTIVPPREMLNIRTGVFVKLPDGYWADIRPRSSTFAKRKLFVMGGTIDNGYTGEISVYIWNPTTEPHEVLNGERLAQLVVCKMNTPKIEIVDRLPVTSRADSGFGSTDR